MKTVLVVADKLMLRLSNDFQRKLLTATIQSVQETSNPLRLNNFSTSFRELFRHILIGLAPDDNVTATSWFKPDAKNNEQITRSQRINYVIHGGLDPHYVESYLDVDVETERKSLLETINRLSKFTHVNEDSFDLNQQEVEQNALKACEALQSFLDCVDDMRKLLCSRIEERAHNRVIEATITETVLSIDEIAMHHCIDEVDVYWIKVTSIDHAEIQFTVHGSVGVYLQWGSNSDLQKGDGVVVKDYYPLTCKLSSMVDNPEELEVVEDSLCIDTSSWWDGYCDEESATVSITPATP